MTLILTRTGIRFYHAMKTGGTWVRRALANAGIAWYEEGYQHDSYDGHEGFTIVRNPLTWYKSFWAFRMKHGWGGDLAIGHSCKDDCLDRFVVKCVYNHPAFLTKYFERFADDDNVRVLRTVTLASDLVEFLRSIGEEFDPTDILGTSDANVAGRYSEDTVSSSAQALIVQSELKLFAKYNFSLRV